MARTESRTTRWAKAASDAVDALTRLQELHEEYQEWRDNLPENLDSSALAEKLDTVLDLDVEGALETANEAADVELPRGFGRD